MRVPKKRTRLPLILLVSLCVAACERRFGAGNEIQYQGETFKLTKSYASYEEYKDDPDNLDLREVPRLQRLMATVKIGPEFENWGDFVRQAFAINFPGYGLGSGPIVKSASRKFLVEIIEIPRALKYRFLVVERMEDERLRLVDDFVLATTGEGDTGITSIEFVDDELRYADRSGTVIRKIEVPGGTPHGDSYSTP